MIRPTLLVTRQSMTGTDIHGQPKFGAAVSELVAPVKLQFDVAHTTVRTDSSATHGHAYEGTSNIKFLSLPTSTIAINDVVTIRGRKVRVDQTHERYSVTGELDHIEVHCSIWR